jgi:two-component system cell cycle sensor histidine kinase/response regulator CckA
VADTGSGIPPEVLPHIFETFFTTKRKGKGTGLGLAIAQSVVSQAGGWLDVRSELGKGTTFLIYIPLSAAALTESVTADSSETTPIPRGHGVILVVEDQEMVRDFTASYLRGAGYEVITASSGDEALELVRSASGRVDLVLTDYNMPGMNGLELIEQLAYECPGIKSILASGFLDEEQMQRVADNGSIQLLRKPYNHKQALRTIGSVLGPDGA